MEEVIIEEEDWMLKEEALLSNQDDMVREQMGDIEIHCVYINNDLEITNINVENFALNENNPSGISKITSETMLQLIEKRKTYQQKKYRFLDVLIYNVDLETEHVKTYVKKLDGELYEAQFLHIPSVMKDIVIEPSIFVFHDLNSIYILFKETRQKINSTTQKIRSILKLNNKKQKENHRKTKKRVKIDINTVDLTNIETLG
jgi:hypothetical protein